MKEKKNIQNYGSAGQTQRDDINTLRTPAGHFRMHARTQDHSQRYAPNRHVSTRGNSKARTRVHARRPKTFTKVMCVVMSVLLVFLLIPVSAVAGINGSLDSAFNDLFVGLGLPWEAGASSAEAEALGNAEALETPNLNTDLSSTVNSDGSVTQTWNFQNLTKDGIITTDPTTVSYSSPSSYNTIRDVDSSGNLISYKQTPNATYSMKGGNTAKEEGNTYPALLGKFSESSSVNGYKTGCGSIIWTQVIIKTWHDIGEVSHFTPSKDGKIKVTFLAQNPTTTYYPRLYILEGENSYSTDSYKENPAISSPCNYADCSSTTSASTLEYDLTSGTTYCLTQRAISSNTNPSDSGNNGKQYYGGVVITKIEYTYTPSSSDKTTITGNIPATVGAPQATVKYTDSSTNDEYTTTVDTSATEAKSFTLSNVPTGLTGTLSIEATNYTGNSIDMNTTASAITVDDNTLKLNPPDAIEGTIAKTTAAATGTVVFTGVDGTTTATKDITTKTTGSTEYSFSADEVGTNTSGTLTFTFDGYKEKTVSVSDISQGSTKTVAEVTLEEKTDVKALKGTIAKTYKDALSATVTFTSTSPALTVSTTATTSNEDGTEFKFSTSQLSTCTDGTVTISVKDGDTEVYTASKEVDDIKESSVTDIGYITLDAGNCTWDYYAEIDKSYSESLSNSDFVDYDDEFAPNAKIAEMVINGTQYKTTSGRESILSNSGYDVNYAPREQGTGSDTQYLEGNKVEFTDNYIKITPTEDIKGLTVDFIPTAVSSYDESYARWANVFLTQFDDGETKYLKKNDSHNIANTLDGGTSGCETTTKSKPTEGSTYQLKYTGILEEGKTYYLCSYIGDGNKSQTNQYSACTYTHISTKEVQKYSVSGKAAAEGATTSAPAKAKVIFTSSTGKTYSQSVDIKASEVASGTDFSLTGIPEGSSGYLTVEAEGYETYQTYISNISAEVSGLSVVLKKGVQGAVVKWSDENITSVQARYGSEGSYSYGDVKTGDTLALNTTLQIKWKSDDEKAWLWEKNTNVKMNTDGSTTNGEGDEDTEYTTTYTLTADINMAVAERSYVWTVDGTQQDPSAPNQDALCTGYFASPGVGAINETVHATYTEVDPATEEKVGTGRYTATFITYKGTLETQTKDVEIPKLAHTHDEITFTAWTDSSKLPTSNPSSDGTTGYYLDKDVTITSAYTISSSLNLCLNGHVVKQSKSDKSVYTLSSSSASLNIYDCKHGNSNSRHYFAEDETTGMWSLKTDQTTPTDTYIDGGVIIGCNGAAAINISKGKLNIYGGAFAGNTSSKGGCAIYASGSSSLININNCDFCGNRATGSNGCGGAVFLSYAGADFNNCYFHSNRTNCDSSREASGGAIYATQAKGFSTDTVTFKDCTFCHNQSTGKGGAAFFQFSPISMTNVTMQYNRCGTSTSSKVTNAWGGAFVANQDYSSGTSVTKSEVYFYGRIIITDNYNDKKGGVTDNVSIENDSTSSKSIANCPTIHVDETTENHITSDSVIGVNTFAWGGSSGEGAFSGKVTTGYCDYAYEDGGTQPSIKYFVEDTVLDPYEYTIAMKKSDNELYIIKHQHDLIYSTVKTGATDADPYDTIRARCEQDDSEYYCKYYTNPLKATVQSADGETIAYDGEGHGVELANGYEFTTQTKSEIAATRYYKKSVDATGAVTWTALEDDKLPTDKGTYRAEMDIKCAHNTSGKTTYEDTYRTITSQEYTIKVVPLKLVVVGNDKVYDGTNKVTDFKMAYLEGVLNGDEVGVNCEGATVYAESSFVCDTDKTWDLDTSTFEGFTLTGDKLDGYYINEVEGYVKIVAAAQDPTIDKYLMMSTSTSSATSTLTLGDHCFNFVKGTTGPTLSYAIEGSGLGCTIADGVLTAGTTTGSITIKVSWSGADINGDGVYEYASGEATVDKYITVQLISPPNYRDVKFEVDSASAGQGSVDRTLFTTIKDDGASTTPVEYDTYYYVNDNQITIITYDANNNEIAKSVTTASPATVGNNEYEFAGWELKDGESGSSVSLSSGDQGKLTATATSGNPTSTFTASFSLIENAAYSISKEIGSLEDKDGTAKQVTDKLSVGDKVTYKITVTNTGNVDVTNVNVEDELTGNTTAKSKALNFGTVEVGKSSSKDADVYTVTEADILRGYVYNYVTGSGTAGTETIEENSNLTSYTDDANNSLKVTKTSDVGTKALYLGDTINYTIKVENDGNIAVTGIKLTDEMLGLKADTNSDTRIDVGDLAAGESATFTTTTSKALPAYTVVKKDVTNGNKIINSATALGTGKNADGSAKNVGGTGTCSDTISKKKIAVPTATTGLTYNGGEQTGVPSSSSSEYTISGNTGTKAGDYTATVTIDTDFYVWEDGNTSNERTVDWSIATKGLTVADVSDSKDYNGTALEHNLLPTGKTAEITGFIPGEGLTSAYLTTNDVNVLREADNTVIPYSEIGTATDKITATYVPNVGTDLANYKITYGTLSLQINPLSLSSETAKTRITAKAGDLTYNNTEQTTAVSVTDVIEGVTTTLVKGTDFTITAGTDKGTYANGTTQKAEANYSAEIVGAGNYDGTISATWKINKASMKIKIVGNNDSVVYDGEKHGVAGYTASETETDTGLLSTGTITPASADVKVADKTEVGTYEIGIGETGSTYAPDIWDFSNDNVTTTWQFVDGALTISQWDISNLYAKASNLEYSGAEQTNTNITFYSDSAMQQQVEGVTFNATGNKGTDASKYYAAVTGTGNYSGTISNIEWSITPATITISSTDATKNYDGTKLSKTVDSGTAGQTTITGLKGTDSASVTLATNGTNVLFDTSQQVKPYSGQGTGDTHISAAVTFGSSTKSSNYTVTYGDLEMTINKADVTVKPTAKEFTYDGNAHSLLDSEVAVTGLANGQYVATFNWDTTEGSENERTDAGTTTTSVMSVVIKNANAVDTTANYNIDYSATAALKVNAAKINVTVTGASKSSAYTGEGIELTGWTAESDSTLFNSNYVKCSTEPSLSKKDKGTYSTELSKCGFKYEDPKGNVVVDGSTTSKFTYVEGSLTITSVPLVIVISDSQATSTSKLVHNVDSTSETGKTEVQGLKGDDKLTGTITSSSADEGTYASNEDGTLGDKLLSNLTFNPTTSANNYDISYSVKFVISDTLKINIVGNAKTVDFSGNTETVEGFTYSASDTLTGEVKLKEGKQAKASGINKGKYSMNLCADDFEYTGEEEYCVIEWTDGSLTINQKEITTSMISATPLEFTYNGLTQGPTVTIKNGDKTLSAGKDYTISGNTGIDAGTYTIVIEGMKDDAGNYTGNYSGVVNTITWKIKALPMTINIKGASNSKVYNGSEQSVTGYSATVADTSKGFFDASKITPASADCAAKGTSVGTYPMGLAKLGFVYNDKNIDATFAYTDGSLTITEKTLNDCEVEVSPTSFTYDGTEKTPTVTVYDGTTPLNPGVDYKVTGTTKATDANLDGSTYTITVTGIGNYSGSRNFTWTIQQANTRVTITGTTHTCTYDGSEHSISGYTVTEASETGLLKLGTISPAGSTLIAKGTNAGTYTTEIDTTKFAFSNASVHVDFVWGGDVVLKIGQLNINDISAEASPTSFTYNGTEQGPTTVVKRGTTALVRDTDYTVSGDKATNVGSSYSEVITGKGNYCGTKTVTWSIVAAQLTINIVGKTDSTPEYDGATHSVSGYTATASKGETFFNASAITPLQTNCVAAGIDAGTYYMGLPSKTWAYDNPNVVATFNIVSDGWVKISARSISATGITATASNCTYNGKLQTSTVVVKDGDNVLKEGVDYTLSGNTATDYKADGYSVTVTGIGNYTGTSTGVAWAILKADVVINITGATGLYTYDSIEHVVPGTDESGAQLPSYTATSSSTLFDSTKLSYSGTASVKATNVKRDARGNVEAYKMGLDTANFTYSNASINPTFNIVADGSLIINPAKVVISVVDKKKTDSSPLEHNIDSTATPTEVTGLQGSDTLTGTLTTNCSDKGIYATEDSSSSPKTTPKTFKSALTWTGSSSNYDLTYDVKLAIIDSQTIFVTGNSDIATYDGTLHEVSGYDSDADSSFTGFDKNKVKLKSGYTAYAARTEAGTLSMGLDSDCFYYDDSSVDYYNIVYVDGFVTVNPLALSLDMVAEGPTTLTYNGKDQLPNYTVTYGKYQLSSKDYETTVYESGKTEATDSHMDVGAYTTTITGKGNFTGSITGLAWNIVPADLTVNVSKSQDYNKSEISYYLQSSDIVGLKGDDKIVLNGGTGTDGAYVKTSGVDAGVYNQRSSSLNSRLLGAQNTAPYYEMEFEGQKLTHTEEVVIGYDYTTTPPTPKTMTVEVVDQWTKLTNYKITYNVELTINKVDITVEPVSLSDSTAIEYDASAHQLSEIKEVVSTGGTSKLVGGDTFSKTTKPTFTDNNTLTNVGKVENIYPKSVVIVDTSSKAVTDNYNITYQPGTLEVKAAEVEVTVTGEGTVPTGETTPVTEVTYDGNPHSISSFTKAVTGGSTSAQSKFSTDYVKYSSAPYAVGTNVGTYDLKVSDAGFYCTNSNFDVTFKYVDSQLVIKPKTSGLDISFVAENLTYNGIEQTTKVVGKDGTTELVEGNDYTIEAGDPSAGTGNKGTNARTYKITIKGKGNYDGMSTTVEWEMQKAKVGIAITGNNASSTYNGSEQAFPSTAITGVACSATETTTTKLFDSSKVKYDGALLKDLTELVKRKDVGTSSMSLEVGKFTYGDTANIDASFTIAADGSLTITALDISTLYPLASEETYDGGDKTTTVTFYSDPGHTTPVTLEKGKDYEIIDSSDTGKDAGDYTVKVKGKGNYSGQIYDIPWKIKQAELSIAIKGSSATEIYNGDVKSHSGFTATLASGTASLFDADKVSLAAGSSSEVTGINACAESTPYTKEMAASDFVYNDSNVTATFVAAPVLAGNTPSASANGIAGSSAGLAGADGSGAATSNGNDATIATNTLVINKLDVAINVTDSKKYDGTVLRHALTSEEVKTPSDNQVITGTLVTDDSAIATYNADHVTKNYRWEGGADANNYNLNLDVTMEIKNPIIPLYVLGNSDTCNYDGQPHTVTGFKAYVDEYATPAPEGAITIKESSKQKLTITQTNVKRDDDGNVTAYTMGLTADDFEYDSTTYSFGGLRDGFLYINPIDITGSVVELGDRVDYTGQEQEQGVDDVVMPGGGSVPSDGYEAADGTNKGTDAGTYEMTIKGKGNYSGEIKKKWIIVGGDEDVAKIGGGLTVDAEVGEDAPDIEIKSGNSDIVKAVEDANALSEWAESGDKLHIWIEITNIDDTISADSRALLESAAKTAGNNVAQFDDVSMYRQYSSEAEATPVHETSRAVELLLTLPEELVAKCESDAFQLLRNHESEVSDMGAAYDKGELTLGFESDKFSDYAVTYTPAVEPVPPVNPPADDAVIESVGTGATGDALGFAAAGAAAAMLLAMCGLAVYAARRRKDVVCR